MLVPEIVYMSLEEEREMAIRGLAGDLDARNRVIMNMLPLIFRIASRFKGRGVPGSDLVQHAATVCLDKFYLWRPENKCTPKTYFGKVAFWQMHLMTCRNGVIVRPQHLKSMSDESHEAANAAYNPISLDKPTGRKDNLGQQVPDPNDGCKEILRRDDANFVHQLLRHLDPYHRKIMTLRWLHGMSFREVSAVVNITKTRVQQIEVVCLRKLRRIAEKVGRYHV